MSESRHDPSAPASAGTPTWAVVAVWVMIGLYIIYFGALTIRQHDAFQTTAFDLGNVDQAVWNTRQGRPFHMTNIEGLTNRLGTHVEPILLPISLLYFVWSDPRVLLLLQTIVIALGAWPVYLLIDLYVDRLSNGQGDPHTSTPTQQATRSVLPLTLALVYLLFPALQSANIFDFHAVALAPAFFLFALYALERDRWDWYALFAVLTMSCKEDMPLLVAMLGLYAIVVRRRWLVGLATMGVAAAWFLLAVGVIMPHFDTRGVSPLANRYAYLGDGPLEMAVSMLTRPGLLIEQLGESGALAYLRDLLAPVAYLPILAPQLLLLGLPPLMVNLLSTDGFMHQLQGFHYGVTLAPVVVVSAGYACAWLVGHRGPLGRARSLPWLLAAVVLVATLLYHRGHGYTPLARHWQALWPKVTAHERLGEEMAGSIPAEASLAALPYPNPHASERQWLYMIDRLENGLPAPLQTADGSHPAEYAWFDVTNSWPLHPNDLKAGIDNLLLEDAFGVDQAADGWLLLRRGAPDKELPDAFYDFARAGDTDDPVVQPRYAMQLQLLLEGEPVLEALGFDLDHDPRADAYSLTFYWRALQPLPPGLRLFPFFLDDATGEILEDTTQRPMISTVWYPPERWAVGEIVQTGTLPWPVGDNFSVGLGVVQGEDWQDPAQRLPIHVASSELVARLFDGDTWARLLQVQDGQPLEEYRLFESWAAENSLDADFGGQVRLLGYDLEQSDGGELQVTLYWLAQARMDTDYSVFLQALDGAGQVGAQADAAPQAGGYPTIWWLPGEVVVDPVTLTLPADGGPYRLIAGLYDAATGTRLPVEGSGVDFVELQTVEP